MYKGCRPNSPITAAFDVLDETRKMYLQYFICTASIGPAYFVPQISAPYIKIGKTILSKRSRARVIGIPPQVLMVFLILKIALSACDANRTDNKSHHSHNSYNV